MRAQTDILVIPDAHARPGQTMERFALLGAAIAAIKPAHVVCLGDLADLPSLSSYDTGKLGYEGRRYVKDVDAARDAQRAMFAEVDRYNRHRRGDHRVEPTWTFLLGNHENRIDRAVESDSKLEGAIKTTDITEGFPWTVHDFLEPVELFGTGIFASHYWASGVMGRSVGGVSPASSILNKQHTSVIQGHTHTLDYSVRSAGGSRQLFGAVCGYFGEYEEWAGPQVNAMWVKGLLVLRDASGNGAADFDWWSYRRLEASFG